MMMMMAPHYHARLRFLVRLCLIINFASPGSRSRFVWPRRETDVNENKCRTLGIKEMER